MKSTSSSKFTSFALLIIALICISISFVQTAIGYELLAGPIFTWLFSFVISAFLLIGNLKIKENVSTGKSVIGILAFFMIIAFFSFAGNFNAFYSQFMETELYDEKLKEYQAQIPSLTNKATISIENSHRADEVNTKVRQLSLSLRSQILDPANLGFGERALLITSEIERLLETSLTMYEGNPSAIADKMDTQINQLLEAKLSALSKNGDIVTAQLDQILNASGTSISSALASNDPGEKKASLASAEESYNRIGELTKSIDAEFAFLPMQAEHLEMGKISHSFYSGFVKKDNSQATLIATLASLAIDFLVPIFILLVYGGSERTLTGRERRYRPRHAQIEIV